MLYDLAGKAVFVAGASGMVGDALVRRLQGANARLLTPSRQELDLLDQATVRRWFTQHRPQAVFFAAGKVGGIAANTALRADFIYENLTLTTNVFQAAHEAKVEKLMYFGSACIYPRDAAQPIRESALLTGPLEPTNEPYAIAKIAGIKMAESYRRQYGCDFISIMPTNLYGPGDTYDLEHSHVIPAMILRFHKAKEAGDPSVTVWGSGLPRREFMYVDDLADAAIHIMQHYSSEAIINAGTGTDISIAALADLVAETIGYRGSIGYDPSRPDGVPKRLLDVGKLARLGWRARTSLRDGIQRAYADFLHRAADSDPRAQNARVHSF